MKTLLLPTPASVTTAQSDFPASIQGERSGSLSPEKLFSGGEAQITSSYLKMKYFKKKKTDTFEFFFISYAKVEHRHML